MTDLGLIRVLMYDLSVSELRYTANTQLEQLHSRYTGTGHADTTKYEWLTHQHRDTLASIIGHPPLLGYVSIADGECQARERFELIEKLLEREQNCVL
uniref:Splicing factor 3B subunit 5 n=1 Tax=Kwoniella pini CBS 10737 TaxID=1296096 RepID=A0A1B9IDW7_9TREE|nr:splicing factor 3B subunit 5 [Kwoniella pini CBS 10737]OCF53829.1 splicing factor 3B subunit 5 [Kwoniella pini CBS 10737]